MAAWAPAPDWPAAYLAAKAPVSLLEQFSSFRSLHPMRQARAGTEVMAYFASGSGAPLVLLPDADRPADFFWRLIACLERRMRVIAVDYPRATSPADLMEGILAVLCQEQIGAASILGFGFGGLLAQSLADGDPARVRALTLVNAPTPLARLAKAQLRRAKAIESFWNFGARGQARRAFAKGLVHPSEEAGFWHAYQQELFGQRWNKAHAASLLRVEAQVHAAGGPCPSNLRIPVLIVETEGVPQDQQPALRRTPARFPLAERRTFAPCAGRTIEITRPRELAFMIERQQISMAAS